MKNNVMLITGASRGIGAAVALEAARKGYHVVLNYYRSEEKALRLARHIAELGGECTLARANVADANEVAALSEVLDAVGGVDVLVNNAGVSSFSLLMDLTEAEWDRIFDINVKGTFRMTKLCLPYMVHNKRGSIINISSMWGLCGASCEVHYSASKAAIIGLTKALAKEMGPSDIRVNCVAPGAVDTDMNKALDGDTVQALCDETPLGRIGSPHEIAKTVLFLASDDASFITGQVISPNGGMVI